MRPVLLTTPRLRLRQFRADDFDRLFELNSDPEVVRYVGSRRPNTADEIRVSLERIFEFQRKFDGELGVFAAELLESDGFIGWFLLRPGKNEPDNVADLELGYRFRREHWGRGFATEGSIALLRHAFAARGAGSVFAQAMRENAASINVMKKIGMKLEREFIDPDYGDADYDVLYRLRRADYGV